MSIPRTRHTGFSWMLLMGVVGCATATVDDQGWVMATRMSSGQVTGGHQVMATRAQVASSYRWDLAAARLPGMVTVIAIPVVAPGAVLAEWWS